MLNSDRGNEFLNEELNSFLHLNGIQQETSAPYTPHQNGNAERFNRTTIEKVRVVLLDSGFDKSFWNYAVDYCSYVRNRLPCQPHGRTPYEMVYNRKPSVEHLRIFGQRCFVLKVLKSWSLGGRIPTGRRPSFGRGPSRRMGPKRVLEGRCPFLQ